MLAAFIKGLEERIKAELRVLGPRNLEQAMEWALRIEAKLRKNLGSRFSWKDSGPRIGPLESLQKSTYTQPKSYNHNPPHNRQNYPYPNTNLHPYPNTNPQTKVPFSNPNMAAQQKSPGGSIRRLTDKELKEKRERGLCFWCDEKWSINHQCRRRELSVLLINEEDDGKEEMGVEECEAEEVTTPTSVGISLNSVIGIDNPKTLKLLGSIEGSKVVVMVDPGATHNFISTSTVEKLKVPISETREFGVILGNGDFVKGKGECRKVIMELGGVVIQEDFFP